MLRRAMGKKIQAEMDAQRDTFIEGCIVPHVSVTIEDGSILRIPSNRMLKRADGGEPVTAREAFEAKAEVIISIKPAKIVSVKEHKSLGINRARAGEFFDLIEIGISHVCTPVTNAHLE